jgi:DNA repair protein RadA/Sms
VQSLISYTNFGMPRRTANGIDYNRVTMLIAVLEKKLGMQLSSYDSYVSLAGGIKVAEPALDLAIVAAIASSFKNKVIDPYTVIFGEVGLAGEVRAVNMAEKRTIEAMKLGFKTCILPQSNYQNIKKIEGIRLFGVSNVNELAKIVL